MNTIGKQRTNDHVCFLQTFLWSLFFLWLTGLFYLILVLLVKTTRISAQKQCSGVTGGHFFILKGQTPKRLGNTVPCTQCVPVLCTVCDNLHYLDRVCLHVQWTANIQPHLTVSSLPRGQRSLTWWARQIRSRSCLCRNLATTSEPKVKDTPLSFSPQPRTSLSGSDQSRSHSRPWSGTSVGRMMRLICSMDWRSGDSPEQKGSKSTNKHSDIAVDIYYTCMRPTAADRLKKHYSRTNDSGWRQRLTTLDILVKTLQPNVMSGIN